MLSYQTYHQLMTPKWIHEHATINRPHALYPQYFEILPTTSTAYQLWFRVTLLQSYVLKNFECVTVTVTAAMNTKLPKRIDHDITCTGGVSDGVSFIGFMAYNTGNYAGTSPCLHFEADISNKQGWYKQWTRGPAFRILYCIYHS